MRIPHTLSMSEGTKAPDKTVQRSISLSRLDDVLARQQNPRASQNSPNLSAPASSAHTSSLLAPLTVPAVSQSTSTFFAEDDEDGTAASSSKGKEKEVVQPSSSTSSGVVTLATLPANASWKTGSSILSGNVRQVGETISRLNSSNTERFTILGDTVQGLAERVETVTSVVQDLVSAHNNGSDNNTHSVTRFDNFLSQITTAHNELSDVVDSVRDSLTTIQNQQQLLNARLDSLITAVSANTTGSAPGSSSSAPTAGPSSTGTPPSSGNASGSSIPAIKRIRTTSGTTTTLMAAPAAAPTVVANPAPAPQPMSVPPPLPAPAPTMAVAAAVNPQPAGTSRSVSIGPLTWQRNITGQVNALMNMMPMGASLNRQGLHARRQGAHYVVATFQTYDDATAFLTAWQTGPAVGYEHLNVSLN